jgi:hypothetical protein
VLLDKFRTVSLNGARAILAAYERECNPGILITIISMMEQKPGILTRNYRGLEMPGLEEDNMIEMAIIIERVLDIGLDPEAIEAYCDELGIRYDSLIGAIAMRDELIADVYNMGLNPGYTGIGKFQNEYKLDRFAKQMPETFVEEVEKIKRCLLDGFRMDLCERRGPIYIHKYIGKVQGPPILSQWVLAHNIVSFGTPRFDFYTSLPARIVDEYY